MNNKPTFLDNEDEPHDYLDNELGYVIEDGKFDINWNMKIPLEDAKNVISKGVFLGNFDKTAATWWSVYKLEKQHYVSFTGLNDVFKVDSDILELI